MTTESPEVTDHRVPNYGRYPVALTHGEGSYLFGEGGRRWLDFLSGIGVNALGHGHHRLTEELRDQLGNLVHCSNLYEHPLQEKLAAGLAAACELDLVFFSNSGAEAVECALKMARRYHGRRGDGDRRAFLALENSFHGRTFGALSVTWNESYRTPFEPLNPAVTFVRAGDEDALARELTTGSYAALILEPIQGESGVLPLSHDYLRAARAITSETGTVLILDEIQCGGGRTGRFLASQHAGITGDIVCLAKPIGAGLPIGATVATSEHGRALQPGDHGSTFGGGALACRAGLVFLSELFDNGLLEHVQEIGAVFRSRLLDLVAKHEIVTSVRGVGLMQALVLATPAGPINSTLLERGLLANATAGNILRFLPPFTITESEVDEAIQIVDAALTEHGKQN